MILKKIKSLDLFENIKIRFSDERVFSEGNLIIIEIHPLIVICSHITHIMTTVNASSQMNHTGFNQSYNIN